MNRVVFFFALLFAQSTLAAFSGHLMLMGRVYSSANYRIISRTPQLIVIRNLSLPKDKQTQTLALYNQNKKIEMDLEKEQKKNFWEYKILFKKAQDEDPELKLVITAN